MSRLRTVHDGWRCFCAANVVVYCRAVELVENKPLASFFFRDQVSNATFLFLIIGTLLWAACRVEVPEGTAIHGRGGQLRSAFWRDFGQ